MSQATRRKPWNNIVSISKRAIVLSNREEQITLNAGQHATIHVDVMSHAEDGESFFDRYHRYRRTSVISRLPPVGNAFVADIELVKIGKSHLAILRDPQYGEFLTP